MSIKKSEDIHTPTGKRAFIYKYMATVRAILLSRVKDMPDDWDGVELRTYVHDSFEVGTTSLMKRGRSKRVRDYRNEVIIKNL